MGRILVAIAQADRFVATIAVGDGEAISKEEQIKSPPFEQPCDLDIIGASGPVKRKPTVRE